MKKYFTASILLLCVLCLCSGCDTVGAKSGSISSVYAVTSVLSFFAMIGYCALVKKKEIWFLLLFASVFVVNIGYFSLSVSQSLGEALLANRISYLGSVFLPMSMLMIILNITELKSFRWIPAGLLLIGVAVFFVAASPGFSDIYYKEVTLEITNGATTLNKSYGPWHSIYLFYLLGYFAAMIAMILHAAIRNKLPSRGHAAILASAVFVNLGVWLLEQMIRIDFECLSVSYIISELFLLGLCLILQEQENKESAPAAPAPPAAEPPPAELSAEEPEKDVPPQETYQNFLFGITELTHTERLIYDLHIRGNTTKEIMEELHITENTLKYHNKNIYGKLGVSSRKQLREIARNLSEHE